jgi:hypothetical protein
VVEGRVATAGRELGRKGADWIRAALPRNQDTAPLTVGISGRHPQAEWRSVRAPTIPAATPRSLLRVVSHVGQVESRDQVVALAKALAEARLKEALNKFILDFSAHGIGKAGFPVAFIFTCLEARAMAGSPATQATPISSASSALLVATGDNAGIGGDAASGGWSFSDPPSDRTTALESPNAAARRFAPQGAVAHSSLHPQSDCITFRIILMLRRHEHGH